jgi:hypothetical protein
MNLTFRPAHPKQSNGDRFFVPLLLRPELLCSACMNLSQLTSSQLKQLAKLAEAREALLARVAKIDRQLGAFEGGQAKPASKPAPKRPTKKRAKHGQVKNAILGLLKQSGKKGITVKEIAVKVGLPVQRIHTWLYSARKSLKQIKKIGTGKYSWQE